MSARILDSFKQSKSVDWYWDLEKNISCDGFYQCNVSWKTSLGKCYSHFRLVISIVDYCYHLTRGIIQFYDSVFPSVDELNRMNRGEMEK